MQPCRRVGLDVTWKCGWRCLHCFYRFGGNEHGELGTPYDVPLEELLAKVDKGRAHGLNHVVLEGWGEPTLYSRLGELLVACRQRGMTTSIITNGTSPIELYEKCYRQWGLDHLHISSHGFGDTLDAIAQRKGTSAKQLKLKEWLKAEQLPFRTNVTLQQTNYEQVPEIIARDVELGAFHCVMLGFISIYEWSDPATTAQVAVHPAKLRPYIEKAAAFLKARDHLFTIRYHPHCHLAPEFWPYIVNARYVFFDPWEWNYQLQADNIPALWDASKKMGDSLASSKEPCNSCSAFRHCGGWNKVTATGTAADLTAITRHEGITILQEKYKDVWDKDGGLHDLNPANHLFGVTPPFVPDSRRGKPEPDWGVLEEVPAKEVTNSPSLALPIV